MAMPKVGAARVMSVSCYSDLKAFLCLQKQCLHSLMSSLPPPWILNPGLGTLSA